MLAMMISASSVKHLMTEAEMEDLMVLQDEDGVGLALLALQALWMKVKALMTLEKLWVFFRRLMIKSWDWQTGMVVMMLTDLVGGSQVGRDVQIVVGQVDLS